MRFNLYWLAVKQIRIGHWLHDKLFTIGLAIHVYRKYGKLNPSVAEIMALGNGGKLYQYQADAIKHNERASHYDKSDPDFIIPDHILISNYNDEEGLTHRIQERLHQAYYNLQGRSLNEEDKDLFMEKLVQSSLKLINEAEELNNQREKLRRK